MTIAAKYPATCTACRSPILPGQSIEWTRGVREVRHTSCPAAPITRCLGCGTSLDPYQLRRGWQYCSADCRQDHALGGQSGYVGGAWHQGSDD